MWVAWDLHCSEESTKSLIVQSSHQDESRAGTLPLGSNLELPALKKEKVGAMKRLAAASSLERINELMDDVVAPLERVQELQDVDVDRSSDSSPHEFKTVEEAMTHVSAEDAEEFHRPWMLNVILREEEPPKLEEKEEEKEEETEEPAEPALEPPFAVHNVSALEPIGHHK